MTRRTRATFATFAACALLLAACAAARPSGPVTITLLPGSPLPIASGPPITTLEPTITLGPATSEIELTVIGGPAEGSYRAVVRGNSCVQPSADQFVANYFDPDAADAFTGLDLDVRDAASAIDAQTDDFVLTLTVGNTTIAIDPVAGQGEGNVLLEIDALANATLDLFGTAADGTEIEVSVLCEVEPI
jgi:hypothetical protein